MNTDIVEAQYVERPLAVADSAPPALFGSEDPVEIVERAVRVADALKAVVVSKNLIAKIQGKDYPQVEAWLTLAAMLRLTTVCEWSRPVENGWEARVFVRDSAGSTVGAAEAQCLNTEKTKRSWEDYALRSMAQTRATSKALRSVLGFVMVLAGYEATPVEEMPTYEAPLPKPAATPSAPPEAEALAERWIKATGQSRDALKALLGERVTMSALRAAVEEAEEAAAPSLAPANNPSTLTEEAANHLREIAARPSPSQSEPKREPLAVRQRKAAMALFGELGYTDEGRHDWYATCGVYGENGEQLRSWDSVVKAGKQNAIIDLLLAEKQERALSEALP